MKNIQWAKNRIKNTLKFEVLNDREIGFKVAMKEALEILDQLDEPEVLTDEQIARKVDRAYKDGYETGKQHATEKQSEETETVARVLVDYLIASAKLKLALSMEVEELEE